MRVSTIGAIPALLLVLAAACGGEAPPPPQPPPAPPSQPVASETAPPPDAPPPAPPPPDAPPPKPPLSDLVAQTLQGLDAAFNAHDAKKLGGYYADDWTGSFYGQPDAHGRDELTQGLRVIFDAFADARTQTLRVWSKGDVAIVESAWAGTMTGEFLGLKPTKKPVGNIRLRVLWFDGDGLVKTSHEYGEDAGFLAQMKGAKNAPVAPTLPSNPPVVHLSKGAEDEDTLAAWGKATDEAFSKDDVKAVVAGIADDADYWTNLGGMPATHGKKDLTRDLEGWFKAIPDQKWTTTNAWGIDGFVVIEHTVSGAQKGRIGPLSPKNVEFRDWHWVTILQPTADGKMQHGWAYTNLFELALQTGATGEVGALRARGAGKAHDKATPSAWKPSPAAAGPLMK